MDRSFFWAFFPIVFFYFLKIFIKKKINDYFKIFLFFSLWLINGHLGHITAYIIFFLIYFIFSIKNFKELRNLFRLPFLISIVFIIFICSESIYFIARELLNFNGWRAVQGTYDIINYIEIFYPKEEFLSKFYLYRLQKSNFNLYLYFFSSISLINFLKSIIQKNKNLVSLNTISFIFKKISSNYALKFNLLFLIFLVFSLLPFLLFIPAISVGGFLPRDIVLYVGIFFFYNYKKIKKTYVLF